MRAIAPLARAAAWLAIAVALALGAGGVVVAADRPPGDESRPELTARADRAVAARLDELRDEVDAIDRDVERLSRAGRQALIELSQRDVGGLVDQLETGNAIVGRVVANAARVRRTLAELPYPPTSSRIGDATRDRIDALEDLVEAAAPLRETWSVLAARSAPAVRLVSLLEEHDSHTVTAARLGTRERYADALEELDRSLEVLDRADGVRDELARTSDVSTLDVWLERSRTYDEALVNLYTILVASRGAFNDEAREAFAEVEAAQKLLPPDTRGLVVIMAEIAQGGLNQSVIAIEAARGSVASASAALD